MNATTIMAAFMVSVAVACSAPQKAMTDHGRVEREVREAMLALERADETLDAEAVVALLAPDFTMDQDGVRAERAATVERVRATLPTLASFETDFENVEVIVIAPDAALVSMTFLDRIVAGDGTVSTSRGPTTFLWRKQRGEWLIVFLDADHYSVP